MRKDTNRLTTLSRSYVLREAQMSKLQTSRRKPYLALAILIASAAVPFGVSALTNAAQQPGGWTQPRPGSPQIVELSSVDQLKDDFENDNGKVRLVVLVSPT